MRHVYAAFVWNGTAQNYKDRFWWQLAEIFKNSRIQFAYFSFHVGLLFYQLFVFQTGHRKLRQYWRFIKRTCQLGRPSVKKTKFRSLYECKGYNARQFTTEFFVQSLQQRLDEEQHHQAAGEVGNSRQASGQQQTQSAYWWKRRHSWVAVVEPGRQTQVWNCRGEVEPPSSCLQMLIFEWKSA